MDTIREVGVMLCACSLLSMLFSYLLPKTGLSGAVKGCAGVFFTAAILYTILTSKADLSLDFGKLTELHRQETMAAAQQKTLRLSEHAVADQIYGDISKEGIEVDTVEVSLHIGKDGCIEISRIIVTGAQQTDVPLIVRQISAEYGMIPEIRLAGDAG